MPIIDRLKQLEEQIEPGATIFFNLDEPTLLQGNKLSDPSWVAFFERLYRAHCRIFAMSRLQDSVAQKALINELHEQCLYFSSPHDLTWPDGFKMESGVLFSPSPDETLAHPEIKALLYLMNQLHLKQDSNSNFG